MVTAKDVHQYARDVAGGKITACKQTRQACLRHLRDLERQGTEGFPFIFSEEHAERFFKFSRLCRHTKGEFAGEVIELDPFWTFTCGSIFGWVHKDTHLRRFKKVYVTVGRKNAKSTICSIIALYGLCADRELGAEIYCSATKREQAKIVYDDAARMAEMSPDIRKRIKPNKSRLYNAINNGFVKALSRDTKTLDGLNPHFAIVDEYHAHPDSSMYDLFASGMGQRLQPLLIVITTRGFSLSSACKFEDEYVEKILEGSVVNEEYFCIIATLDTEAEINEEKCWPKANPLLASSEMGMSYLRGEYRVAKDVPEKWRNFLTKNMNLWLAMRANGYMDMDAWKQCAGEIPEDAIECIMGVDMSKRIDLTSAAFEFKIGTKYFIHHHSWMPEERLESAKREDKVAYDLWAQQGWLTLTPGALVDYSFVTGYMQEMELERGWKIREICFDPYNATHWAQERANEGYVVVEIRQGIATLSGPTADFRDQVMAGNLVHEDDPLLMWGFSNAVTRSDTNLNIMLDKGKSRERIDPAAACMNAHVRAMGWVKPPDINAAIQKGWHL